MSDKAFSPLPLSPKGILHLLIYYIFSGIFSALKKTYIGDKGFAPLLPLTDDMSTKNASFFGRLPFFLNKNLRLG